MATKRRFSRSGSGCQEEDMDTVVKTEEAEPAPKVIKKDSLSKVGAIFEKLDYGPAPESPEIANRWLEDHGRSFGHFINGKWVKPDGRKTYDSFSPATGNFSTYRRFLLGQPIKLKLDGQ